MTPAAKAHRIRCVIMLKDGTRLVYTFPRHRFNVFKRWCRTQPFGDGDLHANVFPDTHSLWVMSETYYQQYRAAHPGELMHHCDHRIPGRASWQAYAPKMRGTL